MTSAIVMSLNAGGTAPAILNAANEVAVASFLNEKISFMAIPAIIEQVLSSSNIEAVTSIQQLEMVDAQARQLAAKITSTIQLSASLNTVQ